MLIDNREMSEPEIRAYIHELRTEIDRLKRANMVMQEYVAYHYYSDIDDTEEEMHEHD